MRADRDMDPPSISDRSSIRSPGPLKRLSPDYRRTTPASPPATSDAMLANTTARDTPPGEARYLGSHTG